MGIALACDVRVASTEASFVAAAVKMGLIPALGITALLPALVGFGRALELAFSGQRLGAAEAHAIGLVNRVFPPDELLPAVLELAKHLAVLPPRTLGLTKRAFNDAVLPDLADRLAREASLQEESASTADHREAIAAFLEKRPPRFTGR
jgi:2-(1,2-epoxy-1,2-dihydrophenyl)acetyl-CoA isomerase